MSYRLKLWVPGTEAKVLRLHRVALGYQETTHWVTSRQQLNGLPGADNSLGYQKETTHWVTRRRQLTGLPAENNSLGYHEQIPHQLWDQQQN